MSDTELLDRPTSSSTELAPQDIYNYAEDFLKTISAPSTAISTKGKRFRFPNGDASPGPINAVVVDFVSYNAYFPNAYDPDDPKAPNCWAIHANKDLLAPDPDLVKDIQSSQCTGCEQNTWQTNAKGKPFKGCKNQYRLALIDPEATAESEVYTLAVSPTAHKNWSHFAAKCREHGLHYRQAICEINWDPNAQQTLTFKAIGKHALDASLVLSLLKRCQDSRLLYRSPDSNQN